MFFLVKKVLRNKCHRIIPHLKKLFCVSSRRFRGNHHRRNFCRCCSFWRTLKNVGSLTGPLKPLLSERTLSNDYDDDDKITIIIFQFLLAMFIK